MLRFHSLRVANVRPEAADAVRVTLEVPAELAADFRFLPGQHLGVRTHLEGQEIRRTYSITNSAGPQQALEFGIRIHDQGTMSRFLATRLKVGDQLEVLPPYGSFHVTPDASQARNYVAFAGGSGITPILSIVRSLLAGEPRSHVTLFYANRTVAHIMFAEELLALKDRYLGRFAVHFVLSREPQEIEALNGRLDGAKVRELAQHLFTPQAVDMFLLCGPGSMIDGISGELRALGVPAERVHAERFTTSGAAIGARLQPAPAVPTPDKAEDLTQVTVVMDGRRRNFTMPRDGETVLEAAERAGLDLPFSCRGGVCSTCRTRVVRGAVTMAENYALEPWELEAGFVLACQSHPTSAELEIDYDDR